MKCAVHPDRPATQYCQKTRTRLCDECAVCHAPTRYCQFRTSCLIWNRDAEGAKPEAAAEPSR